MKIMMLTESLVLYNYSQFPEIVDFMYDNDDVEYIRKDEKNDMLEVEAPKKVLYDILWELTVITKNAITLC